MLIYLLILLFVYLVSVINPEKIDKIDLLFFCFLAIIAGVRYGVGTDFFEYVHYFNLIEAGNTTIAEPGFVVISQLVSKLNFNSQVLFILLSLLTMFFLYSGLKYYTEKDNYSKAILYILMLIYTFFPSLNVVRQILAAVIILFASRYIIEKNFVKFIIWVFIATLFHSSSIVFIALYFLVLKNYKRIFLFGLLIVSIIVSQLGVITSILEYITINLSFLDVNDYIQNYLKSSYNAKEFNFGIVFSINLIVLSLFIILKDRLIQDSKSLLTFNFFYLYILSYILSIDAYAFSRFNYYFGIYMGLSISRFPVLFDSNSKKVVEYTILVLYSILYLYIVLFQGSHDIIPYEYNLKLK